MKQYTRNVSSQSTSLSNVANQPSEKPKVFTSPIKGKFKLSQFSRHKDQVSPYQVKAQRTPEAASQPKKSAAASPIKAHFAPQYRPRRRSVQEIFYKLGLPDPTPDMPSSSPNTIASLSIRSSPVKETHGRQENRQDTISMYNRSSSYRDNNRTIPSSRLTCHSWFVQGECHKPPGQCQYSHMHTGQGVGPLPSRGILGRKCSADEPSSSD